MERFMFFRFAKTTSNSCLNMTSSIKSKMFLSVYYYQITWIWKDVQRYLISSTNWIQRQIFINILTVCWNVLSMHSATTDSLIFLWFKNKMSFKKKCRNPSKKSEIALYPWMPLEHFTLWFHTMDKKNKKSFEHICTL